MKLHRPQIVLILAAGIGIALPAAAQSDESADPAIARLLKEGLFAEEAEGDAAKAEAAYRAALARFDADRRYGAAAALRLAEILRNRAPDEVMPPEVAALYERVLREFADQSALAEVAAQRLLPRSGKQWQAARQRRFGVAAKDAVLLAGTRKARPKPDRLNTLDERWEGGLPLAPPPGLDT
ncbi:MAG: hypothetical protein R3F11_17605 [Verrucomicrobiales bacterium]